MGIATWILVGVIPVSAGIAVTLAPQGTPAAFLRARACEIDARTLQIARHLDGCQGGRFSAEETVVAQLAAAGETAAAPQPRPDVPPVSADLQDSLESNAGPVREKQPWDDPRWADRVAEKLLPKLLELPLEGPDAADGAVLSAEAPASPAAPVAYEPTSAARNPAADDPDPTIDIALPAPVASGEEMTRAIASASGLSAEPEGDGAAGPNQAFDRDVPMPSFTRDPARHDAEASEAGGRKAASSKRARNEQVKTRVAVRASHGVRAKRQRSPDLSSPIVTIARRVFGPPRPAGIQPRWVVSR